MRRQRQMCSTDDSQRLAKQRRFAPEPAPRWEHPMCRHRLLRLRVAVVVVPTTSIFAFEPTIVLVCEARDLRLIRAGFMRDRTPVVWKAIGWGPRSEESRGGKEGGSRGRSRGGPD